MSQRAAQRRKKHNLQKHRCRFIHQHPVKMNPSRDNLLKRMSRAMAAYFEDNITGIPFKDYLTAKANALHAAKQANQEWIDRSRGKGGNKMPHGKTFIKSVALAGVH